MTRLIRKGGAPLVEKQSHRVSVYELLHEDRFIYAAYDEIRKQIVTFFPLGWRPSDPVSGWVPPHDREPPGAYFGAKV